MRKSIYPLLYLSLFGFIMTTVMNLLHNPGIALFLFVASFIALFAGCIIAFIYPAIVRKEVTSTKKNKPRRYLTIICLLGIASIVIEIGLKKNHLPGSRYMMLISLFILLLCFIIFIWQIATNNFTVYERLNISKIIYPSFFSSYKLLNIIICIRNYNGDFRRYL
jgi:hypothetical protein